MTDPVSLRERKKRATRLALSEAALRLSVERGFDNVTVEDIASAVDVSTRTFFNYFSSKEEAVMADNEQRAEHMAATLLARPKDESVVMAVCSSLLATLDEFGEPSREWAQQVGLVQQTPNLLPHLLTAWSSAEQVLTAAIVKRTGTDPAVSMHASLVAAGTMSAARVATQRWIEDPSAGSLAELLTNALGQLDAGLPTPS